MTRSIWLDDNRDESKPQSPRRLDVVIVGGGLIGASLAYLLSLKGDLTVLLLESGQIAGASSGRNAGFVLRGIQTYYNACVRKFGRENANYIYRFVEENQSMLRDFVQNKVHGDVELDEIGSYILATSIEELEELAESAQLLDEDGFSVDFLKEDPLDRDYYGALFNPLDFGINPVALVKALLSASGVETLPEEHVLRITRDRNDGPLLVHAVGGSYECDRVLLATNAYSALVDSWFRDKFHIARGQILVTEPLAKEVVSRLCYANYGWVYFRQLKDRRFLLGGRRQLFINEEIGYADMITPSVQAALEEYLKDYFPDVVGARIDYRFSGLMAFTNDGLPIVGEHEHMPGLYFALAFNGHGLGYGMRMARQLIELAFDGVSPGIFDVQREGLINANPSGSGPVEQEGP
ncbi:MAG: FAD-binding oxidoreductase [Candidatus Obscuribacterales bacterium]|nr:FAD-binding oxidoreductase [Candidatus Obscuribacterales bacterium]